MPCATPPAQPPIALPTRTPSAKCRVDPPPFAPHLDTVPKAPAPETPSAPSERTDPLLGLEDDETESLPATARAHRCPAHWALPRKPAPRCGRRPPVTARSAGAALASAPSSPP